MAAVQMIKMASVQAQGKHLTFLKNFGQISLLCCSSGSQMPHQWALQTASPTSY